MMIICDLDGTLSDCRHRQHLAVAGAWEEFHALAHQDLPHQHVLELLRINLDSGNGLIFLTGRPEYMREATMEWLSNTCGLELDDDYLELLMRPKDDWASDIVVKQNLLINSMVEGELGEWLRQHMQSEEPLVLLQPTMELVEELLFLDDRDKVVAMWRDLGYACWQTMEGAF